MAQYPSVSQVSLTATGSTVVEEYIPLWIYSHASSNNAAATPGMAFFAKGTGTSNSVPYTSPTVQLHSLNVNWAPGQRFAFEAAIYIGTGYTGYAELWDMTTNTAVSGSQISTTASTFTLIRSGSFTLTPGHLYGVCVWTSGSSSCYLSKAHLVALMM